MVGGLNHHGKVCENSMLKWGLFWGDRFFWGGLREAAQTQPLAKHHSVGVQMSRLNGVAFQIRK